MSKHDLLEGIKVPEYPTMNIHSLDEDKETIFVWKYHGEGPYKCPPEHTMDGISSLHLKDNMHLNAKTLFPQANQAYWWPKLKEDCKQTVKSCLTCQRTTTQRARLPIPFEGHLPTSDAALELMYIDHIKSLPGSYGYIFISCTECCQWIHDAFPAI